ncbi:hypothetical protein YC2023_016383 [Brassica napus]
MDEKMTVQKLKLLIGRESVEKSKVVKGCVDMGYVDWVSTKSSKYNPTTVHVSNTYPHICVLTQHCIHNQPPPPPHMRLCVHGYVATP